MEAIPIVGTSLWFIAKVFVLVAIAIYFVFAVVIIKQVNLMINTISIGFEIPIKMIAWAHLLFAIGIFVLAIIIL